MIDWFKELKFEKKHNDDLACTLDEVKNKFQVKEFLPERGWLVYKDNDGWIDWAIFEWFMSDGDGSNVMVKIVIHGCGPAGSLRECRHTYWGDEGYVFYPNKKFINAALEALSEWYDLD